MEPTAKKHYKFIHTSTGYVIYYYSVSSDLSSEELKVELDKVRAQVAVQNAIPVHIIYWEEIK